LRFWTATHILRVNFAEIDQDNLHIKFSALNVNFSGQGPNLLRSTRSTHGSVKYGYPFKKW